MKKFRLFTGLVGLLLLVGFFTPYVVKLPQLDITLILVGGLILAAYDFYASRDED